MDEFSEKSPEEFISYFESINTRIQSFQADLSSDDIQSTDISFDSSSSSENVKRVLECIKTRSPKANSESDTEIDNQLDISDADIISIKSPQYECNYEKLSLSTSELELKYEMSCKNNKIHELNETINDLKQILKEKDSMIESKDKNICFLMRSQKETNKKYLNEKEELKQLIENLQNDSWTNLNPVPETVSVLVQTDNDKKMNDNDINKAMISMKLKMNQKSKEWTNERKTLLEKIDELKFKLDDSIKENNELTEKLEKKSASSSESIEIVESPTQNDKFEIDEISNQISDYSVQTDESFESEKKELTDKVNQLMIENSQKSMQITDLENLLNVKSTQISELLCTIENLNIDVNEFEVLKSKNKNLENSLEKYENVMDEFESRFQIDNIENIVDAFQNLIASNKQLKSQFENLIDQNETLKMQLDKNQLIVYDIVEKFSLNDINDIFQYDIDKNQELNEKLEKLNTLLKKRNCEIDELKQIRNYNIESLTNNLEKFTCKFSEKVSNRLLQLNHKLMAFEQNYFNSLNEFYQLRNELNEKSATLDEIRAIQYRDCSVETDRTVLVFDQSNYDDLLSRISYLESTLTNEQTMRSKSETLIKQLEFDIQELIDQQKSIQRVLDNYRNPHTEESIVTQDSFAISNVKKLPIIPENEHEDILDNISCSSYFSSEVSEICVQRDMYLCGDKDNNDVIDNENTNVAVSKPIQKSITVLVDEITQIIFENEQMKRALENSQINIRNQRQKSDIEQQILTEKYEAELEKLKQQLVTLEDNNNVLKCELNSLEERKNATNLEYENQIQLLENRVISLNSEYKDLKISYEECKANCEIFTNENNELHANLETKMQELSNYSKTLIEKSELIEAQASDLCKLRDEISLSNKNKCEIEDILSKEIENRKNFDTKYINLKSEYDDLIEFLTFEKAQIQRDFESERISLKNQIQELETEIVQIKNDLEMKKKSLEAVMLENNNLQKLSETQSENLNNLMNNFKRTDDKLNHQYTLFSKLNNDNDRMQAKIMELEAQNQTLSCDLESAELFNKNLESEKKDFTNQISNMSINISNITKELEILKDEYETSNSKLRDALKNIGDKKILINSLETEIFKLREQKSELEEKIKSLKISTELEIEQKNNEIEELNKIVEQLNEENELSKEYLEKRIENLKASIQEDCESSGLDTNDKISKLNAELDRTLYVLYQRDLRCEELTLELENLLRERDALQICLSNALRLNEQLKTCEPTSTDAEHLRDKLSELQSVSHLKDIRLKDEREYRYAQQASMLSENRIGATKPLTEEIINKSNQAQSLKNNTIDEDSQQSSSSLLSWLW